MLVGGRPLAVRVAEVLAAAGCSPVVLVGNQPALVGLGFAVLREPPGSRHPLRGLAKALETLGETLITPCDLVDLAPVHVASLRSAGESCVAEVEGVVQPLLGCFAAELAPHARAVARAGGAARSWAAALHRVPLDPRAARNLNTPGDLAAWRAEIR
jgi:molybdopterin-guanine dinucleotide biosynthesis protein A